MKHGWFMAIAVCALGTVAITAETTAEGNARWVNMYFDAVYRQSSPCFVQAGSWADSLLKSREKWTAMTASNKTQRAADVLWADFCQAYPMESDWLIQDRPDKKSEAADWGERLLNNPLDAGIVREWIDSVLKSSVFSVDKPAVGDFDDLRKGLLEYERIRVIRRERFLAQLPAASRRWVFVKVPHTLLSGANHYAYTESLSDHPFYKTFKPGAKLCVLELKEDCSSSFRELVSTEAGSLRDPEVSFDAERILFAMRNSGDKDDYHLYELECATGKTRQLTEGIGHADYEAIYTPAGDIVFNSTRCVQTIDCDANVVSVLYTCDRDGKYMRRLGFDQVTVNYPKLLPDGRVIYTRWDYNDRSQVWPQGLFQMNPDGTKQTEYYGNNSWFPTSILHARPVPGSRKVIAVLGGHHAAQKGKLALIDPTQGTQENEGVLLVAPESKPEAVRIDQWGVEGDQYKHPFALDEQLYLASFSAYEGFRPGKLRSLGSPFWLYVVNRSGERELLAADETFSCLQAVPLARREPPTALASLVDYSKPNGHFYMQDIYYGPGLQGIPRGTIRSLRVVELIYRHFPVGVLPLSGPGSGSASRTPVALNNGTYDVKRVLGEATVYEDGSASFHVPARTPVYFQAIDHKGHVVQTMRSWSTLMPNESFGCIGCHESKGDAPPMTRMTQAMKAGPQELKPFYDWQDPVSFPRDIQPILDRHCISCHDGARFDAATHQKGDRPVSLRGDESIPVAEAQRKFSDSYIAFCSLPKVNQKGNRGLDRFGPNPLVNWMNVQEVPTMLPPYHAGATKSGLINQLEAGHEGVKLSREELDKIACWIDLLVPYCGDYMESNAWSKEAVAEYLKRVQKREESEAQEKIAIKAFLESKGASQTP